MGRFYRTTQNHNLLASDKAGRETREQGKVMAIIPLGSLVLVTKRGRLRFVQVMFQDMIGYIWLNTNVATMSLLEPVDEQEGENDAIESTRGPFVKPTKPANPKR